jgi:hypothetical protein
MWRTYDKINGAVDALADYTEKLSEIDTGEAAAILAFIIQCFEPFLDEYYEMLEALENGEDVQFRWTVPDWIA